MFVWNIPPNKSDRNTILHKKTIIVALEFEK